MKTSFDDFKISRKFRMFFQRRKYLRLNEDFMVCVFLILIIIYRFRFIHPQHIAELFSCSNEEAWNFADKLVKRGYLVTKHLEESNVGFLVDGEGTYLFSIGRKGITFLREYGIESCSGKRSKARASSNLFHDMLALLLVLKNADELRVSDFYPDFYIGQETQGFIKKPDIFILDYDDRIIWMEIERTPKAGKRLQLFFWDTLCSLFSRSVAEVHVFVPPRKNVNYENIWGNDRFILAQNINGMENLRDDPDSAIGFYHQGKATLLIHESNDLYTYRQFQGEKPDGIKLKRQRDPVKK